MSLQPVAPWAVVVGTAVFALAGCLLAAGRSRRRWAWVRRAAMVALVAVVALRPGSERADADVVVSDLDVFFVVDRTGSMVAQDHDDGQPRMAGVAADVLALADALPTARWSLVGFDDEVTTLVPLITDATALRDAVSRLRPEAQVHASGSSPRLPVGALIDLLAAAEEQEPGRRRVVFVFTDGETTAAAPDDTSYAPVGELAVGGAVLGYGTDEGGRMLAWDTTGPTDRYLVDPATGTDAVSVVDRAELRAIAEELGVPLVDRTAGDPLAPALDAIPPSGDATTPGRVPVHQDLGWWWAYPLLALVWWEVAAVAADVARFVPARSRVART